MNRCVGLGWEQIFYQYRGIVHRNDRNGDLCTRSLSVVVFHLVRESVASVVIHDWLIGDAVVGIHLSRTSAGACDYGDGDWNVSQANVVIQDGDRHRGIFSGDHAVVACNWGVG